MATVCALVIGVYAYTARSGIPESGSSIAADNYYNLLVQGFRAGQLSLKKEVPPGFTSLADPYDPTENVRYRYAPYGMHDMSYYKGRLYIYFGVTPALILLWPYVALTGHFLSYGQAGVIFYAMGFLAGVYLLRSLWRTYFGEVSVWVVGAGGLALGLAAGALVTLARCDVWEVPISCAYALTMLTLTAIWKALHERKQRCWWLAAASLAYGLAVGARPSLLFGAVILLVPVAQAWRERRQVLVALLAATVPIALIGLGLMLYNVLRFDSPFEFGFRYQLAGDPPLTRQFFSLRYLWFNFRIYFLEPARWSGQFPFVHDILAPPPPAAHGTVEPTFGILTNIPLVWMALAVPLAWRARSAGARSSLCAFVAAVAMLFAIGALTLGLYYANAGRYEVEFLHGLVLLAVIGILSVERTLAYQPLRRRAMRWGWSLLLAFSVAFNALAAVKRCAEGHRELGDLLIRQGKVQEAIGHYEQALRIKPDDTEAHKDLAYALLLVGKVSEAIEHCEQALRIKPDFAEGYNYLGVALVQLGRLQEAIEHYEQALRIRPDYPEAHNNLGNALIRLGRIQEAIEQYQQALRIKPDWAEAQYNLGNALAQLGRLQEAIDTYEQALRIQPDFADAYNNLAWLLATHPPAQGGDAVRAVTLAQRACELTSNGRAGYLDTLAAAYAAARRFSEAVATAQRAIELARAAAQPKLVAEVEARLELYRSGHAYFQSVGNDESRQLLANPSNR